jgi:hypothetical protein
VILGPAFEAPTVIAGFDDIPVVSEAIEQCGRHLGVTEHDRVPLFLSGSCLTSRITDPYHFLFWHRLKVLKERSGRGPRYVVVARPDNPRLSNLRLKNCPADADPKDGAGPDWYSRSWRCSRCRASRFRMT